MSGWWGSAVAVAGLAIGAWLLRRLEAWLHEPDAACEAHMAAFRDRERAVLAEAARIVDEYAAVLAPLYVEVDR